MFYEFCCIIDVYVRKKTFNDHLCKNMFLFDIIIINIAAEVKLY